MKDDNRSMVKGENGSREYSVHVVSAGNPFVSIIFAILSIIAFFVALFMFGLFALLMLLILIPAALVFMPASRFKDKNRQ